jgi:protein-S-isoprenylcysteine O-methyltransferase Ste14
MVRRLLSNLVWLIPTVALAGSAVDVPFFFACALVVAGSAAIGLVADPTSLALKAGGDRESELWVGLLLAAIFLCAGLQLRVTGPTVPPELRAVGLMLLGAAYALRASAMAANRFFAGVLVIQHRRGHRVIESGPYGWVRHPGNTSAILIAASLALAFGSSWAMIGAALVALVVLRRTQREDRFLCQQLIGYREYAGRVQYRLIPGLY